MSSSVLESGYNQQVLVAILNHPLDLALARDQHWYRIPVSSVEKWLQRRWPPHWLAFYLTKVFQGEAYAIHYYAQVLDVREVARWQLFPDQPPDAKSRRRYYQLLLAPLQRLDPPIASRRWRRITFIQTTWQRFVGAIEINDLYDDSPLEDALWHALKQLRIPAERQEFIVANGRNYALDFAVYCATGKLDLETDGDTWHADPARIPLDNLRDNDLAAAGWHKLRFNTKQVQEQLADYCVPEIVGMVNRLGGIDEGLIGGRRVAATAQAPSQPPLFDD